jgi:hypothetical protein
MDAAAIISLIATIYPIAEKVGVDVYTIIEGLKAGKTVDQLITEATADRTDLPNLTFTS